MKTKELKFVNIPYIFHPGAILSKYQIPLQQTLTIMKEIYILYIYTLTFRFSQILCSPCQSFLHSTLLAIFSPQQILGKAKRKRANSSNQSLVSFDTVFTYIQWSTTKAINRHSNNAALELSLKVRQGWLTYFRFL